MAGLVVLTVLGHYIVGKSPKSPLSSSFWNGGCSGELCVWEEEDNISCSLVNRFLHRTSQGGCHDYRYAILLLITESEKERKDGC
ncbi:hypothetical protein CMV_009372 [Castanea mollissima]|uniref:Uncharacterized protein n=1 Tax=Castanea mollissima TaxID=60419 RepID=A0A8J4VR10_9ROSI|nr:hypothetical protein CMV_009372 [Castanea mollissima]